jgi:hypothetical protein
VVWVFVVSGTFPYTAYLSFSISKPKSIACGTGTMSETELDRLSLGLADRWAIVKRERSCSITVSIQDGEETWEIWIVIARAVDDSELESWRSDIVHRKLARTSSRFQMQ